MRSLGRAIDYEAARQVALLEDGGRVIQETRHWDEGRGETLSMRSKEEANDYRYFPEPDLVPLAPDAAWRSAVASSLGPLPAERRATLAALMGGPPTAAQAEQIRSTVASGLDHLITAAAERGAPAALALVRTANEVAANAERAPTLDPAAFATLLTLEDSGRLSATQSKDVLAELLVAGGNPEEIARRMGFESMGEDALIEIIDQVVAEHPAEWDKFLSGDPKVQGVLIGSVMKASGSKANGKAVAAELARRRAAVAG